MFGRDMDRMLDMWMDLLSEVEKGRHTVWANGNGHKRRQNVGSVEEREDSVVLSADLPGVEKKDIELSVDHNSVAFKAKTEERDYDFGQTFDFELNPDEVKAIFNNGVLDVVVSKKEESKGKSIEIE